MSEHQKKINAQFLRGQDYTDYILNKTRELEAVNSGEMPPEFRDISRFIKSQLYLGNLKAFGRQKDDNGNLLEPEEIPASFWMDSKEAYGGYAHYDDERFYNVVRIIDDPAIWTVELAILSHEPVATKPLTNLSPTEVAGNFDRPAQTLPAKAGRKSRAHQVKRAMLNCLEQHIDFPEWTVDNQILQLRKVARALYPNSFGSGDIGHTTYYATKNSLKESGDWPSKNVQ